ncbi:hypothetical protein J7T55_007972 [Diaporthe amygdali]|uniref:uncharacterized protein n=1 Tax=Phomopsis amygdali TaxID=1214568 RepID=UPI0022FE5FBD|nr:uncharacterized protein J7T55_007972 [Diaporthe amygdali]KAJ0114138.1 hypothetical protein J7T55_007972 [Diaporthe amygdali]
MKISSAVAVVAAAVASVSAMPFAKGPVAALEDRASDAITNFWSYFRREEGARAPVFTGDPSITGRDVNGPEPLTRSQKKASRHSLKGRMFWAPIGDADDGNGSNYKRLSIQPTWWTPFLLLLLKNNSIEGTLKGI